MPVNWRDDEDLSPWMLLTWSTALWRTLALITLATVMTVRTTIAFVSVTTVTAIGYVPTGFVCR